MLNIESTPINFNNFVVEHRFITQFELTEKIKLHYIRQLTTELYKIIGSLDIIGNPVLLIKFIVGWFICKIIFNFLKNDFHSGFKDFFYEPAKGLFSINKR
jgi:hypothetical protein